MISSPAAFAPGTSAGRAALGQPGPRGQRDHHFQSSWCGCPGDHRPTSTVRTAATRVLRQQSARASSPPLAHRFTPVSSFCPLAGRSLALEPRPLGRTGRHTAYPDLETKRAGDDVKRLQRVFVRTKDLGPDNLDGVFGPQTEKVVKDFQQSNGLVVDGVVGPITWSHLHPYREASPTLQAGSLGPVVAMLQNVLKTGFGYSGAIDGIFGPVTEAVVRQYQTNSSLPVTGVMDERTWIAPAGAAGATLESLSGLKL